LIGGRIGENFEIEGKENGFSQLYFNNMCVKPYIKENGKENLVFSILYFVGLTHYL